MHGLACVLREGCWPPAGGVHQCNAQERVLAWPLWAPSSYLPQLQEKAPEGFLIFSPILSVGQEGSRREGEVVRKGPSGLKGLLWPGSEQE